MKKYDNIVNYGTIVVILILIIIVFFKLVPDTWFVPLLYLSVALLIIRIIFRVYFIRKNKKLEKGG